MCWWVLEFLNPDFKLVRLVTDDSETGNATMGIIHVDVNFYSNLNSCLSLSLKTFLYICNMFSTTPTSLSLSLSLASSAADHKINF